MTNRADIKRSYRETPKEAGIFQIRNTVTGKIFLGSSTNLNGPLNRHRFQLSIKNHPNRELQQDWDQLGANAFAFEIVEVVRQKDELGFSLEDELTLLEMIWLEKTQPLDERSYNKNTRIRD